MMTKDELDALREVAANATQVVSWYPHGVEDGTVRGPYHRWFKCTGNEDGKHPTANIENDVNFAAAAMNNLVPLLDHIEELERQIVDLTMHNELTGDSDD